MAARSIGDFVRRRLSRVFVRRGLRTGDDARAMPQWERGGGLSVDASGRIEAAGQAERERLLRYIARPPFAVERLRSLDLERLIYDNPKPGPPFRRQPAMPPSGDPVGEPRNVPSPTPARAGCRPPSAVDRPQQTPNPQGRGVESPSLRSFVRGNRGG